ncbi:hypothetical protein [Rhizobium sp. CECT 9324]|uniref:hypothetical protein n=1 Tax=Rhizobium sp. CECT 9324 TaxID=2845820 RepID=UPI001E63F32D|nr:hypothetical protein [Rhizobium sp. CECT 9324]
MASPVLQTGPHCLLLYEPDAFYTHLFSLLGLQAQKREWHITYFVSTTTFKESAKKGAGWLQVEGTPLNLFGLPRSRMDGRSIGCLNGPYRFALTNSKGDVAPNASAARLLSKLPSDSFASAAEAIKRANQVLWEREFSTRVKLLQLDDFDIADLVADHLEETESWMSAYFIGDGAVAECILRAIDRLNEGAWAGWLRRTTDLFWRAEKDRMIPLRLQDRMLKTTGESKFELKFSPHDLATALRQRAILPSLFTAFLVTSILPGARALGGCRQTIYLPLMRYLVSMGIKHSGDLSLLNALNEHSRPGAWGHRVLTPTGGDPLQEIERAGGVLPLLTKYGGHSLAQSSGDLASFTRDPIWAELSRHIASGSITRASQEWRWSAS